MDRTNVFNSVMSALFSIRTVPVCIMYLNRIPTGDDTFIIKEELNSSMCALHVMQILLVILLSETGSHPHLSGVRWLSTSSLFQNRRKGTCIHSQAFRAGTGKAWGFRLVCIYSVCPSELFSTLMLSLTQHLCMLCLLRGLHDTWSGLWLPQ